MLCCTCVQAGEMVQWVGGCKEKLTALGRPCWHLSGWKLQLPWHPPGKYSWREDEGIFKRVTKVTLGKAYFTAVCLGSKVLSGLMWGLDPRLILLQKPHYIHSQCCVDPGSPHFMQLPCSCEVSCKLDFETSDTIFHWDVNSLCSLTCGLYSTSCTLAC